MKMKRFIELPAEQQCHCDGLEVHCEDESLVAQCHCHEDEEIHCELPAEQQCHCDGLEVHCEDETLVALCHCHEGEEIHCEEHEEGRYVTY
jgi:hypothetical protein